MKKEKIFTILLFVSVFSLFFSGINPHSFQNAEAQISIKPIPAPKPLPELPSLKPDLTIESLTLSPENPDTDDLITFKAVVKNIGNLKAEKSTLEFRIGGETPGPSNQFEVPPLEPGKTYTETRQSTLKTPNNYGTTAIADVLDVISESNEDNNKKVETFSVTKAETPDSDGDGTPDDSDRCPREPGSPNNAGCPIEPEPTPLPVPKLTPVPVPKEPLDVDNDKISDHLDNCPRTYNPDQSDFDGDGIGDVCDSTPYGDIEIPTQVTTLNQYCQWHPNILQDDIDGDGYGDYCDDDIDGDELHNVSDNCAVVYNPDQQDSNNDGFGDVCSDGDHDGVPDFTDNCPDFPHPSQLDRDNDGMGDYCDDDLDGDGELNENDNCIKISNPAQSDSDGDGVGDECDYGDFVNAMFPASTKGGGMVLAFPDVCLTPVPIVGAVPIPYPNIAMSGDKDAASKKVKVEQKDVMTKDSEFKKSQGGEAGRITAKTLQIPAYVKNVAEFWEKKQVDDDTFLGTIEYMINTDIITIPDIPKKQSTSPSEKKVPDWVRTSIGYWKDGFTTDAEVANSLGWLVGMGIIQLDDTTEDTDSDTAVDCTARGNYVDLHGCDLSGEYLWNAELVGANLAGADLSGAFLTSANLNNADLSGTNLRNANLVAALLNDANLSSANLSGANLSTAEIGDANLSNANLLGADISGGFMSGTNLSGANLINARLPGAFIVNGADLTGADLSGATLGGAFLNNADITNANLSNAFLNNVNLSGTNLDGANLTGADTTGAYAFPSCVNHPICSSLPTAPP